MQERRKYPRADVAIALKTAPDGEDIRTVNLSASGVAYESPRWVEPFTKFEMIFVFPEGDAGEAGEAERERLVRVEAVVMRTEPEEPRPSVDRYRVACCFTSMRPEDHTFVGEYVERVLAASESSH